MQEDTLCRFVAVLAYHHKLKHRTIKSYLSGLRFFHIQEGLGNPWLNLMPRLEYTLQGVKRVEAHSGSTARSRLPITLDVLLSLKSIWCPRPAAAYDGIMLWAAACVGFFGFLRVGEFTVPSPSAYDPHVHLNTSDLSFDNHEAPNLVGLRIKQSKTDPFRQGVDIFMGATGAAACPVVPSYGTWKSETPKQVHYSCTPMVLHSQEHPWCHI